LPITIAPEWSPHSSRRNSSIGSSFYGGSRLTNVAVRVQKELRTDTTNSLAESNSKENFSGASDGFGVEVTDHPAGGRCDRPRRGLLGPVGGLESSMDHPWPGAHQLDRTAYLLVKGGSLRVLRRHIERALWRRPAVNTLTMLE
jgi:hypothetical protein